MVALNEKLQSKLYTKYAETFNAKEQRHANSKDNSLSKEMRTKKNNINSWRYQKPKLSVV